MLLQRHQGLTLTRTRRSGGAHQPHPLGAVAKLQSGQPNSLNRLNNDIQASPSTSRWVQCHSTSHSHAARSSEESTQTNFDNGVILVFKKWARTLSLLGALAAWSYLSYGNTNSPFASMSLSIPSTSSAGPAEIAAKSGWAGLMTGVLHTLCGPDHLAGLTPLSIGRSRLAACALGCLWGFGHSTGQLVLGLAFALLKDKFHDFMPALDTWSSYIVPLTIITIGLIGIYESLFKKEEEGEHSHGSELDGVQAGSKTKGKFAGFATYATGIVHGLQPDALFVVIPALALPTTLAAISFISMFVIGTVASMGGYTLLIGTTSQALIREQPWLHGHLSTLASGIAIAVGLLMLAAGQGVPVPFFS